MAKRSPLHLNSEEKSFFSLIDDVVKANPFSESRIKLDLKITGLDSKASVDERVSNICREIETRFSNLKINIGQYRGVDRTILRSTVLFLFFHLFLEKFDAHIKDQVAAKDQPVTVKFADQAMAYLLERGFEHKEALHYVALSFQLRRTFYFIDNNIKGNSKSMLHLKESLWNNIFTNSLEIYNDYLWNRMEDFSTLILGETGTGKGAVAAAIGRSGYIPFDLEKKKFKESFNRSFVSLNLSQYSENLIESELFGHKKGAFTGAVHDRKGIFNLSSRHGAIFLDEIGEVSTQLQIKLLKVLEERLFFPVGGYEAQQFKGRIIAATNRSAQEILEKGILRQDFFYRLCSDLIVMPPLRQRLKENPAEMDALLSFTLKKILGTPSPSLEKLVKKALNKHPGKNYPWPGNVREFAQCVRRILLNHQYTGILHTPLTPFHSGLQEKMDSGQLDSVSLIQGYCHSLYQRTGTYGQVAKLTRLDRRTVKKYILEWDKQLADKQGSTIAI